jgi:hypothetical protein
MLRNRLLDPEALRLDAVLRYPLRRWERRGTYADFAG